MCLADNIQEWTSITSGYVLEWIESGIRIPFEHLPASCHLDNRDLSIKQCEFVDCELESLLLAGAIRKCSPGEIPYCVSPINVAPKKNNKLRLVVDLRHVNDCVKSQAFRNENIDTVKELIQPQDILCSIDLKNGYHHVPVNICDKKYLGIQWKNKYYVWCVLPFGLKCSSYYFCKTLRPAIQFLREQGIRLVSYVDDILLMSKPSCITDHREFVLQTLAELGFNVNFEKSHLEGDTCIEYIGFNIHTDGECPSISVPKSRLQKLKKDIRQCIKHLCIKARFLARIAGQCISMCKAILPGKLLLRNIYRLLGLRDTWDSLLQLDAASIKDLQWWLTALSTWNGAPLKVEIPEVQIVCDASSTGWGAACMDAEASGVWSVELQHMPSNYRELMAVHMALLSFKDIVRDKIVQVLSDNVTTVAYLNNLGGHCLELSDLAQAIWCTTNKLNVTLSSIHLAGKLNSHADHLSRLSTQYEWMLSPNTFRILNELWGPFTIDRFASFLTTQLPRYNARFHDPQSMGVDAMAQDWANESNFVNPPFRLIPRILHKVQQDQAEATLIAPWWPGQPWFKTLLAMTTATPWRVPKHLRSFTRRDQIVEPLKNPHWQIYAFKISGKRDCNNKVGVKTQARELRSAGLKVH